jgi:hypothetical protein
MLGLEIDKKKLEVGDTSKFLTRKDYYKNDDKDKKGCAC